MDDLLSQLEILTQQMASQLQIASEEELIEYVDERESLVDRIKATPRNEQKKDYEDQVRRILKYDAAIMQRMEWFQQQNYSGMNKINTAKRQKSAYDGGMWMDSVLFDKRK